MAVVGHTASRNIFLEIPSFVRSLSQSMNGEVGPSMTIGPQLQGEIFNVDPLDPTSIVDEYSDDWWNYEEDWKTHPLDVDQQAAYKWHIEEVHKFLLFCPPVNIWPDRQYGYNNFSGPQDITPAPESSTDNPCTSHLCEERLHQVLGQLRKANRVAQSMGSVLEEDRISAARHILSLKALKRYQVKKGKRCLEEEDVDILFEEVEKRDVEMQGVGSTSSQSLTPQSLSYDGFDSDSDYVP